MTGTAIPRAEVQRALVRFPNWLGDTVMALPALRALRAALPGAELWCVGPWVGPILELEPGIARRLAPPGGVGARLAQARRLRQARFDVALILPNSFETALAGWLSGARWRVGYGDGRAALLTHALPAPTDRVHQVTEYLKLLAPFGVEASPAPPTLGIDPARRVEARRLLDEAGVPLGEPRVGLQLGAALGPAKLWPSARIAALAARLVARGIHPVLLGGPQARGARRRGPGGGRRADPESRRPGSSGTPGRAHRRSSTRSSARTAGPPTLPPRSGCRPSPSSGPPTRG